MKKQRAALPYLDPSVSVKRLLICRGGTLGDLLLTVPVFNRIRQLWPCAHVCYAGYLPQARLIMEAGLADTFLSLDSAAAAEWFAPIGAGMGKTAAWFGNIELVITFIPDDDGCFRSRLVAAGVGRVLYRSPCVPVGHAADYYLGILDEFGGPATASGHLRLPGRRTEYVRTLVSETGGEIVALHPGSGSKKKNWALKKFLELAIQVRQAGIGQPVFILGEAESECAPLLHAEAPDIPCVEGIGLPELADLLSACHAYVGNDSGVTHLAAALGVPVVGLFGPTDPAVWAPRGDHVRILSRTAGRAMPPDMEVADVLTALRECMDRGSSTRGRGNTVDIQRGMG